MEGLPPEIAEIIFRKLEPVDLLNTVMVSKRCFGVAARILPDLDSLKIAFKADCPTRAEIQSEKSVCLDVCQCGKHIDEQNVLEKLLPIIANAANSLEVEDELVKTRVTDEQISRLFAFCSDAPLKRLALSRCDLINVRPWTLALLAKFDQLEKLEIEDCTFSISESMLIRSLSTSFQTLTNIDMRDNKQITDKFARTISRSCPNLEIFRFSGCPLISTFSVLSLIESTFFRIKHELTVHMDRTTFSADQLHKYMNSPLFAASSEWRLCPAYVQLGYEKPAVLAEHRQQRCVLIYV
ncbi:unnamed protein product [Caenorhabditis angaria]|uniref:F-box domain-containing protein n=1 Tax=Caenorhabditis angaria TaxID=860376 RepID=A0A9P1IIP9_9PELO|nr:unnamed protein product [Caenorhabditis angaria]